MAKLVICPHEESAGDSCEFRVQGRAEEVIRAVRQHAETAHDVTLARADVERLMEDV